MKAEPDRQGGVDIPLPFDVPEPTGPRPDPVGRQRASRVHRQAAQHRATDTGLRFGSPGLPADVWEQISEDDDGCWRFRGRLNRDGYGVLRYRRRPFLAHRLVWVALVGPLGGATLDHRCRVRSCVRPAHLEPVSRSENSRRRWRRGSQPLTGKEPRS